MSELPKFVYDLPYHIRKKLCSVLDVNDKWEELGGVYMGFDVACLYQVGQAVRRNHSPTNELLQCWETHNHTITELFVLLSKMQHYQAMVILKPFVETRFHALIYEGEENLSRILIHGSSRSSSSSTLQNNAADRKNLGLGDNLDFEKSQVKNVKEFLPKEVNKIKNNDQTTKLETLKKPSFDASTISPSEACTPVVSYKELEIATNNWSSSNILGRGGFGTVFVGTWKNTRVAIKRLEPHKLLANDANMELQRQQSYRELKYLNECRHNNILALFAYSVDGERYCLVYQFMPNGSLEDRLLCRHNTKPLTWSQRYNIARGTALGLLFLHDRERPLVHGDIKSANILLDKSFEPRIGDFGLTQEGPLQQYTSIKVSRVHGTKAYLPEEFFRGKKFSVKVDVYSFGIVLFEIATGLRAYDEKRPQKLLRDYVHEWDSNRLLELMDRKIEMLECRTNPGLLVLGKVCTHLSPKQRLDMVSVLGQIDAIIATHEITSRAQQNLHLMRQNTLSPSNPYEMQLMHDVLRQSTGNRLSTPSPLPTRSTSPGMNTNTPRRSSSPAKLTHIHGTIVEEEVRPIVDTHKSMVNNGSLQRKTSFPSQEQSAKVPKQIFAGPIMNQPPSSSASQHIFKVADPPVSSSASNDLEIKSYSNIPLVVQLQMQDLLPQPSVSTLYASSKESSLEESVEPVTALPQDDQNCQNGENRNEDQKGLESTKSNTFLPQISELLNLESS